MEHDQLKSYLSTQNIFHLPENLEFYNKASNIRRNLRSKGITIRNTIDLLIAMTAIYNKLQLLHNDRDFDFISEEVPELRMFVG